ncbi:MAG: OmpA family protein [Spirochaetes bacterium]|nr:OmpA family protein [Spirochaetota bacterium]
MIKKICVLCLIIFTHAAVLSAQDGSGRSLLLLGESASSLGMGGTGATFDSLDMFFLNPASIGSLERLGLSVQYGDLVPEYKNPNLALAFPTSYGNFGIGLKMIDMPDSVDITRAYYGTIGTAKEFNDKLLVGLSIDFMTGSEEEGNVLYAGLGLGAIYSFTFMKATSSGFGIYDPKITFAIRGGFPFDEDTSSADLNTLTLGYSLGFFHNKYLTVTFLNEISAVDFYSEFPVKIGFETVIMDNYIVRLGGNIPDSYDYADLTAGLGYRFRHDKFMVQADYSLVYLEDSTFVHYAGLTLEIGELDRTPPVTKVESDNLYISPNYDGKQDYVMIDLDVSDKSKIQGWSLQILDSTNSVVREYKVSEREMKKSLTPLEFAKAVFKKKESMVVPDKIMWDGTDRNGVIVKDGNYKYSFMAWDERNNYSLKKTGDINVDNDSPQAEIKTEYLLFSPNGDKKKDELVITQNIKSQSNDRWEAGFLDASGNKVKTYSWTGNEIPSKLKWDGKDNNDADVPEGLYTYYVRSKDEAGNEDNKLIREITLTRQYQTVDISTPKKYFSFKNDKKVVFNLQLSDSTGLSGYKLTISDMKERPVKVFEGVTDLPEKIEWDVKDGKGEPLSDGIYFFQIETVFDSGNNPSSYKKELIVDSTPPKAQIGFSPKLFSPDDDGENDILTITPEADDEFEIDSWEINIYNPSKIHFKKFSGNGLPPRDIKWDGLSDKNELVESASDYAMEFTVKDKAGNTTKLANSQIPVDILVIVTDRGLKIKISNIQFAFGSAKIIGNGSTILKRVAQILQKYEGYNIIVEGHTDDIGKEDYNLKLSEERARAVTEFLIQKGIARERLTYMGMGETSPFLENVDEESRRKNRRVEFLLVKPGEQNKNITEDLNK